MNTHRIAASAGSIWFWRGVAGLEALLLVVAVAIILVSRAPVGGTPAVAPAGSVSAPAFAAHQRVIACKPCQQEVLAAAQAWQSGAVAAPASVSAPAAAFHKHLIACTPCREEVLAATLAQQQVDPRGTGPR
jgi:hypothetical protein